MVEAALRCMATGCMKSAVTHAIIGDAKWPLCRKCAKKAIRGFTIVENRRKIFDD